MVRRLLITFAVLAMVALTSAAVIDWRLDRAGAALETSWREMLGGASFVERYPPTQDNKTVLEMEGLAAGIGLEMALPEATGHQHPTPEAAQRFAPVNDALKTYLDPGTAPEDGLYPPPPEVLETFLARARPELDALVDLLTTRPLPVWEGDLSRGFEAPVPNYEGVLQLQRLWCAEALERVRDGRIERALEILEASWRLDEAVRASPLLIAQLISYFNLKEQMMVLRSLPAASPVWRDRLATLDLRRGTYIAFQTEVFMFHHAATLDRPLGDEGIPSWVPFVRWTLRDAARRLQPMVEELVQRDVRSLDPEDFNREMRERVPRWHPMSRFMQINLWDAWAKAARVELSADLTLRVLEERARQAAGGPPRTSDPQPSRVRGLQWIYEETSEGTWIHLDGDLLYKAKRSLPLRFLVRARTQGTSKTSKSHDPGR